MIWAPISELPAVGRSPIYVVTLVVFVFFQFGVIYAKNIGMLLAFRFITGLWARPSLQQGEPLWGICGTPEPATK
jgi:DHA1 family multidrug resistance protein-like MFS transporter